MLRFERLGIRLSRGGCGSFCLLHASSTSPRLSTYCSALLCALLSFSSCSPPATHASARLQIKTRNILISFFLLDRWTPPCPYLFNIGAMSFGCLMRQGRHFCEVRSRLLSHRLEKHNCNCGRKVYA